MQADPSDGDIPAACSVNDPDTYGTKVRPRDWQEGVSAGPGYPECASTCRTVYRLKSLFALQLPSAAEPPWPSGRYDIDTSPPRPLCQTSA